LNSEDIPDRNDPANWPIIRNIFESKITLKTRKEWEYIFSQKEFMDACVTPVLSLQELSNHPFVISRNLIVKGRDGKARPRIAPILSDTPGKRNGICPSVGEHTVQILSDVGYSYLDIEELERDGVVSIFPNPTPKASKI